MQPWQATLVIVGISGGFFLGARWLANKLMPDRRIESTGSNRSYYKSKHHSETIHEYGLPAQHAGHFAEFFLSWLIKHELTSPRFERGMTREGAKTLALYRKGKRSIHDVYREWDDCLISDMLDDEGNAFAGNYFDLSSGKYLADYQLHLQKELPSTYHIEYTPANEQVIHSVIDVRYAEWKALRSVLRPLGPKARQAKLNLAPPASRRAVEDFEAWASVRLPEDYRDFLLTVADGGQSPCRLLPLARWSDCYAIDIKPVPNMVAQRCSLTPSLEAHGSDWLATLGPDLESRWDRNEWCPTFGTIAIAEIGCGSFYSLIVTGEYRGRIFAWGDHPKNPPQFVPEHNFNDWLEHHLDRILAGQPVHFLDGRIK